MNWRGRPSGKRGRSQTFSDEAIQFCLSIKCLFNLPLRQAMGMVQSLLHLASLDWAVPDYSTISRAPEDAAGCYRGSARHDGFASALTARASRCWVKAIGRRKSMA